MNRRDFIRDIGKISILTLLGYLLWGYTQKKSSSDDHTDKSTGVCRQNGHCRKCPMIAQCKHPTALSFKQARDS